MKHYEFLNAGTGCSRFWEEACTAVLREAAGLNENTTAPWGPLDLI